MVRRPLPSDSIFFRTFRAEPLAVPGNPDRTSSEVSSGNPVNRSNVTECTACARTTFHQPGATLRPRRRGVWLVRRLAFADLDTSRWRPPGDLPSVSHFARFLADHPLGSAERNRVRPGLAPSPTAVTTLRDPALRLELPGLRPLGYPPKGRVGRRPGEGVRAVAFSEKCRKSRQAPTPPDRPSACL
jgi:hypothetical protein